MDGLMKQADMYLRLGDMEIMAKLDHLRELEEAKDDPEPKPLLQPSTPMYTFVPMVHLPDDAEFAKKMKFHVLPPQLFKINTIFSWNTMFLNRMIVIITNYVSKKGFV
jgi:hypothetical protein